MLRVSDLKLSRADSAWSIPKHKINQMQVSVPRDPRSGQSKGFAFIQYYHSDAAKNALSALDGQNFHGRLLHIMPSPEKKLHLLDEYEISKLPLKKQKQIKRKAQAASSSFEWNSMYMNVGHDAPIYDKFVANIVSPTK